MTSILTWNINLYIKELFNEAELEKSTLAIVSAIRKICPDILCLQEASKGILTVLTEGDRGFSLQASCLTNGGLTAILTKSAVDLVVKNPSVYTLAGCSVEITGLCETIGIPNFTLVNYHLVHGKNNQDFRVSQVKEIVTEIPDDSSRILIGDTNWSEEGNFPFPLTDVGIDKGPTWFMDYFRPNSPVTKRYDRVYTDMPVKNFSVLMQYKGLSDHVPVSVTV